MRGFLKSRQKSLLSSTQTFTWLWLSLMSCRACSLTLSNSKQQQLLNCLPHILGIVNTPLSLEAGNEYILAAVSLFQSLVMVILEVPTKKNPCEHSSSILHRGALQAYTLAINDINYRDKIILMVPVKSAEDFCSL